MRSKTHAVQVKAFTERLENAMARFHAHSLTTEEMIQELVQAAHDIKAALDRGEDLGMTEEEIVFSDALAENESAVQVLGGPTLKVIAQELVSGRNKNMTVDWAVRQQARARLRMLVRNTLNGLLSTGHAGRRRKARAPAGRIPHRSLACGCVRGRILNTINFKYIKTMWSTANDGQCGNQRLYPLLRGSAQTRICSHADRGVGLWEDSFYPADDRAQSGV